MTVKIVLREAFVKGTEMRSLRVSVVLGFFALKVKKFQIHWITFVPLGTSVKKVPLSQDDVRMDCTKMNQDNLSVNFVLEGSFVIIEIFLLLISMRQYVQKVTFVQQEQKFHYLVLRVLTVNMRDFPI